MTGEIYSIEVSKEEVILNGYLTIPDLFTFITFYENKGYKYIIPGDSNSSMRLSRIDYMKLKVEQ